MYLHVFSCLCSVPGKNHSSHPRFGCTDGSLFNTTQTCLLFSVDLEMKANCFHLSSPFPPALSVSFCFCQTHIFRSLSPWRLPRNTPSPEIFFQFVCFCLSDHWRCPGPDPAATESDLRLWHLSLIVWYVQPKLIGWNSCQGLHTRKKALVC